MRRTLFALAAVCALPLVATADEDSFVGTWNATYGQIILTEKGEGISGTYGGGNTITGTEQDRKFKFTYAEGATTGEGEFVLSPDGNSFTGKWRVTGSQGWSNWTGTRVKVLGEEPGVKKPVVYRYGKLPEGMPAWFTEADTDRDGQIGLYEWVKHWGDSEAKLAEFKELDLNGDGLITVEEYQRVQRKAAVADPGKGGTPSVAGKQPGWGQPPGGGIPPGGKPNWGQPPGGGNPFPPSPGGGQLVPAAPSSGKPAWGQPPAPVAPAPGKTGEGPKKDDKVVGGNPFNPAAPTLGEGPKKDDKVREPKKVPDPKK